MNTFQLRMITGSAALSAAILLSACNTAVLRGDAAPAATDGATADAAAPLPPAASKADDAAPLATGLTATVAAAPAGPEQTARSLASEGPGAETQASQSQPEAERDATPEADIWRKLGRQLFLSRHLTQRSVKAKLAWYARNQAYLDRVAERATPYLFHIDGELEKRDMPMELALLPVVESAFQPFAYSPSHASGIWQFIPSTGRIYGLKQNWWYDGRRDIVAATTAALNYLEKLNREFDGDWLLALAAYNTGERNVARSIRRNKKKGKETDFFSLRLPRETRGYVPSLLAVAELVANPEQHGVAWTPIKNEPYFAEVDSGGQIDLAVAAELANLDMDEIYKLNPAYNRWATDPKGPHRLLVPVAMEAAFLEKLAELPESERASWKRHIIKRGETLGKIAARHRTSVATLKKTNNLRGNLIRTGHSLLIPVARKPGKHYTLSLDNRRLRGLKSAGDGRKYIYTVRRGDTLWDIGRQYGVSVPQLASWNGISSKRYLRPGQKLNLWLGGAEEKLADGNSKTEAEQGPVAYTVKKGDSLWLIARKFNVTVKQLLAWNNLRKNSFLRPNQTLRVSQSLAQTSGL